MRDATKLMLGWMFGDKLWSLEVSGWAGLKFEYFECKFSYSISETDVELRLDT